MKRILCFLAVFACLFSLLSFPAAADTGPKAAVHIRIEGREAPAYATLLSKNPSTGPQSAYDEEKGNYDSYYLPTAIWQAFQNYEDADGYYFLQIGWELGETSEFTWGYYPPSYFKVLLYFPESDSYAVSDICQRYAFDTYYTVRMSDGEISSSEYDEKRSGEERLVAFRLYEWQNETFALLFRMVLTLLIEVVIALLFGFRKMRALLIVVALNVLTQILLNAALICSAISFGSLPYLLSKPLHTYFCKSILRRTRSPRTSLCFMRAWQISRPFWQGFSLRGYCLICFNAFHARRVKTPCVFFVLLLTLA